MSMRDEALSMRVREALSNDKRVSSLPIGVHVSNGDVFLQGTVDSLEQVDVAQFVVMGIPGVRHVSVDDVEVRQEVGR